MAEKHRSGINFKHFLKDQVELYPFSPDEAAIVELVANSLDAKSSRIEIDIEEQQQILQLVDNGVGMSEQGFKEYHDFAMSPKKRGEGIGFAGLGAKLGLWLSKKVETETQSGAFSGCSEWFFEGDDIFWQEKIQKSFLGIKQKPKKTLAGSGTRTTFYLKDKHSQILLEDRVKDIIKRHYYPLFDPILSSILLGLGIYQSPVEFYINGKKISFTEPYPKNEVDQKEVVVLAGKGKRGRTGIGYFILAKEELPEEQCGVFVCCYGKIITREWFGIFPKDMKRITGFVEVPSLTGILTTTKSDFLKTGANASKYYTFRREMQKEFSSWLEKLGKLETKKESKKGAPELEKLLKQILGQIPELRTIFASPTKSNVSIPNPAGTTPAEDVEGSQPVRGLETGGGGGAGILVGPGMNEGEGLKPTENGKKKSQSVSKTVRFGPQVGWEEVPTDLRLSWVNGDTIVINSGNAAYKKAAKSGYKTYHDLLAISLVLVKEKGPNDFGEAEELMTKFFKAWGGI